jgi:hypothetical protein
MIEAHSPSANLVSLLDAVVLQVGGLCSAQAVVGLNTIDDY